MELMELERLIGIKMENKKLYEQAFTHTSYAHERKKNGSHLDNERLEFLGDAVLEVVVSEYLYHRYPDMNEGDLTRTRARIVCESSLASFAKRLDFGRYVRLGKGEEMTGGRIRPSLLADVLEAFIGSVFLDQGFETVKRFLYDLVLINISDDWLTRIIDAKSQLQELIQQEKVGSLEYRIVDIQGPAHDRQFDADVYLGSVCIGKGSGRSKKEAEQHAALTALEKWQK